MGGCALHKAATYKGQHNVQLINVPVYSMAVKKRELCFPEVKIIPIGDSEI
jgi:hypothetical protein